MNTRILELETDVEDFSEEILFLRLVVLLQFVQEDSAEGTTQLEAVVRSYGDFITDRGKVSEDTMRVQDLIIIKTIHMLFVLVNQLINGVSLSDVQFIQQDGTYLVKFLLQPHLSDAQLNSLRIQTPMSGSVGDFTGDDTFTPELASLLTTIFQNIFGRRLGTTTDGTSLVSAPMRAYDELSEVPSGRELTLTSVVSVTMGTGDNPKGGALEFRHLTCYLSMHLQFHL